MKTGYECVVRWSSVKSMFIVFLHCLLVVWAIVYVPCVLCLWVSVGLARLLFGYIVDSFGKIVESSFMLYCIVCYSCVIGMLSM